MTRIAFIAVLVLSVAVAIGMPLVAHAAEPTVSLVLALPSQANAHIVSKTNVSALSYLLMAGALVLLIATIVIAALIVHRGRMDDGPS